MFDENSCQDSLTPRAVDDLLDFGFARVESAVVVFSIQNKALEITESVVNKSGHFPAIPNPPFTSVMVFAFENWLLHVSPISSFVTPMPFTNMPSLDVSTFGFVQASTSSCERPM
jgi:hypothetical protein